MRKLFLIFLLLPFLAIQAQNFEYRSAENPYYWKNRKPDAAYWQQDVHYKIDAILDDSLDVVSGREQLTYYNNSPDTLYDVYFHLYQNSFIRGSYMERLNVANHFKQKFGKYEEAGKGTELSSFMINGMPITPVIDYSIMKVKLLFPILPNSSAQINMEFKTYFEIGGNQRRRMKIFTDGFGNKQYDGVHWYPRICVYDRKFGWATDQHLGKEFYGDFGQFEVSLSLPNQYILDATGELQNELEVLPVALREKLAIKNFVKKPWEEKPSIIVEPNGTYKTWKFRAVNTHDFAWVADPTFRIGEVVLDLPDNPNKKVRCIALAQEQHAARWQDAALFCSKIIQMYSRDFGTYAYPKMICADARDGMEYPMLTLDGGGSPGYYFLIAHEVGHNWFFGMVGNNETYRACLDEGFTQFLSHWSMSRLTEEQKRSTGKSKYFNGYYRPMSQMDQVVMNGYLRDAVNQNDMTLNTHSDDFNGALNHGGGYGHVYYKTATMLYNLQYVLGDDLFIKAMQHYFNQYKMCHPYVEDFRNSIIQYTHVDLNWFFDQWMETTKSIDYGIDGVKRMDKDQVQIRFSRKGSMQMPIDFSVIGKDSSVQRFIIPNTYFAKKDGATVLPTWRGWGMLNQQYTTTINYSKDIKYVVIDPSHRLADINQLNNSTKCPVLFSFDHQINNPPDRLHYIFKWRPAIWFNNYDGLKAGLHVNGNYLNQKHVFKLSVWYNTGAGANYDATTYSKSSKIDHIHYSASYANRIGKFMDFSFQSRSLDGIYVNQIGINKTIENTTYRIFAKSMHRVQLYYLPAYQQIVIPGAGFYPEISSYKQWNNILNLEVEKNYNALKGNGSLLFGLRSSALFSDFDYATVYLNIVQNNNLSKFEIRTRLFAQYMTGTLVAPESQLYLAGANPEEMIENKYTRSAGTLPADGFKYGTVSNHLQTGGGLNIRGYTGYLMPVNVKWDQYYLYKGNSGAAVNLEIDYDKFIPLKLGWLSKYFHIDSYLFMDAGLLKLNNPTILDSKIAGSLSSITTPVLASGGAGFALTIKKFGILDEPKPLVIRFDMPVYLSNAPFEEETNFKFRWLIGIQRCF